MTKVSTDYGVLCSETSLVAVERLKTKVEGEAKPIIIPIAITKDSQSSQILDSGVMMKKGSRGGGMMMMKKKMKKKDIRSAPMPEMMSSLSIGSRAP